MRKKLVTRMLSVMLAAVTVSGAGILNVDAEEVEAYTLNMTETAGGSASIFVTDTSLAEAMVSADGEYQAHKFEVTTEDYEAGEVVHIKAIPASGYYFAGWTTEDGGEIADPTLASTSYVMPEKDALLMANFKAYADEEQETNSFLNLNGVMWFYNTYFGYKYTDITADLDNLKSNGINILGFFCPYDGDPELYDGCDPLDWYDVPEQCGTIDDFKALVSAAHDRGMKVICYFVNIYIDKNSEFFKKAEKQYAAGDYDAKECSAFYWADGDKDNPPSAESLPASKISVFGTTSPAPFLQPFVTKWEWSETAGAWYCNVWKGGGLNFDTPGAHQTSYEIEKFWLDTGLDGFMFDVASPLAKMHDLWVNFPRNYTSNDKWLSVERSDSSQAEESADFGYNCWFNYGDEDVLNDYGRVISGEIDSDGLEAAFQNSDKAHELNCWTFAWSIWGDDAEENLKNHTYPTYENDELMRVQEAALLAGGGITYGCGMYDQYLTWSDTLRANWNRVLRTVNENAALLPSASRTRLATESEQTSYAMIRTSADESQTAVLVYNLSDQEQIVTVDLTGTSVADGQVFTDLYNGGEGGTTENGIYQVTLPAYGFQLLEL